MRRPLDFFPTSWTTIIPYKLDNYNSTKAFPLSTQTHLREARIETYEGGGIRTNRKGQMQGRTETGATDAT